MTTRRDPSAQPSVRPARTHESSILLYFLPVGEKYTGTNATNRAEFGELQDAAPGPFWHPMNYLFVWTQKWFCVDAKWFCVDAKSSKA